jgi:hypothetical protein
MTRFQTLLPELSRIGFLGAFLLFAAMLWSSQ